LRVGTRISRSSSGRSQWPPDPSQQVATIKDGTTDQRPALYNGREGIGIMILKSKG
jgi:hypothetical protein